MGWTKRGVRAASLVAVVGSLACGDDVIAPYGGSEGGGSGPVRLDSTSGGLHESTCFQDSDCEDENECTQDRCIDRACVPEPVATQACRPSIEVFTPARAATLQSDDPHVEVRGRVLHPAADDAELRLNDQRVELESDGTFSHVVVPEVGGNTLVFEVTDALGQTRKRVQAFLWSTAYHLPTTFPEGSLEPALAFYLDQESLDDGTRDAPPNDIGSVVAQSLDAVDLQAWASDEPLTHVAGYDVLLESLTRSGTHTSLEAIDDGFLLELELQDIQGDLRLACLHSACDLTGGDGNASFGLETMRFTVWAEVEVDDDHRLQVSAVDVVTEVDGFTLGSTHPWADTILSLLSPILQDLFIPAFEAQLGAEVERIVAALLEERLGALSLASELPFSQPGTPGSGVVARLETDLLAVDIHDGQWPPRPSPSQGAAFYLRGGVFVPGLDGLPEDHLGIPARAGCAEDDDLLDLPREGALEIAWTDDLLNQVFHAAWRAGMLDLPLVIRDLTGEARLNVQGMLPPTVSDCNPEREVQLYIGDLRLDAEIELLGSRLVFTSFSSLAVPLEFEATSGTVGLRLGAITKIDTQIVTEEDAAIDTEALLERTVEDQLEKVLGEVLAGPSGFELPLPSLGASGLTPRVEAVEHRDGVALLTGHF